MAYPAPTLTQHPAADRLAALLTPISPLLPGLNGDPTNMANMLCSLIKEITQEALQEQFESDRRNKLVTATEVGELLNMPQRYVLVLRARGELKSSRKDGTTRYYFRLGDVLDWQKANLREDNTIKRRHRTSAPGVKQKGR